MKPRLRELLGAAFNARPLGMVVPPNWVALAAFGLLGTFHPGFWLIGAGLELGYLGTLVTNRRFQRLVAGRRLATSHEAWDDKLEPVLASLDESDRRRYAALTARCRAMLGEGNGTPAVDAQGQGLSRLAWVYLRLLVTRRNVERVLHAPTGDETGSRTDAQLSERLAGLRRRLEDQGLDDDLRRSLASQADIVEQRLTQRKAARDTLAYVEAELARIEEQVELFREQAALDVDPEALSRRLDEVVAGLSGTNRWIAAQQQVYGTVEDLLTEPPPLTARRAAAKESQ
jgi:hypothetical protein